VTNSGQVSRVETVFRSATRPWVEGGLARITEDARGPDDVWLRLAPIRPGPLPLTLHLVATGGDLFIDDFGPPLEIDPRDDRDLSDLDHVVHAALDGRLRVDVARTPTGLRPYRLLWDGDALAFSQPLLLGWLRLRKETRTYPPYGEPASA
jgi:hypothetical protein